MMMPWDYVNGFVLSLDDVVVGFCHPICLGDVVVHLVLSLHDTKGLDAKP
jgi:hypothetical protein